MLSNIPTYLIAGPLGAGKTSLIRQLLEQRPVGEQWAVLINEFGQVGIDTALLADQARQVQLAEIPGGCLCCVNGLPFQVGLGRLLRRAKPDRLFIEASGLGHPLSLLKQLSQPPWVGVLQLQGLIMVLDVAALARGEPLAEAQEQALHSAALIVMNKSEALNDSIRQPLVARFAAIHQHWTAQGMLKLSELPVAPAVLTELPASVLPTEQQAAVLQQLWRHVDELLCSEHSMDGFFSIGWRGHPAQCYGETALQAWLTRNPWQRAKGIVHTGQGWLAFNAVRGEPIRWQPSDWRRDNRIELIDSQAFDRNTLERGLRDAQIKD